MARHSGEANWTGRGPGAIGPLLLQAGVGGVVMLSAEASDHVAIAFSGTFYRELAGGKGLSPNEPRATRDVGSVAKKRHTQLGGPCTVHAGPGRSRPRDPGGEVGRTGGASRPACAADTAHWPRARLQELAGRLRGNEVRSVTLTGPGGTGKTRLALEVARQALPLFGDGVCFISLVALRDPEDAPSERI